MTKPINCFEDLVGHVLFDVINCEPGSEVVGFQLADGRRFRMWHEQSCCEGVDLYDVNGDIADLLGSPILVADERSSNDTSGDYDSATWTFYTLRTIKGSVDLRWLGVSNGYYSESVDFEEILEGEEIKGLVFQQPTGHRLLRWMRMLAAEDAR